VLKSQAVKFVTVSGIACAVVLGGTSAFADSSYTVQPGNNLSEIAAQYGETWQQLENVNHLPDPNLIFPGEIIDIPSKTHTRPIGPEPSPHKPIPAPPASSSTVSSSGIDWDAVAECESSGDWSINTGNGYYGGLQFSESTWRAYGGGAYALYANEASKEQQIIIAERVLKGQGIGAWPVCGKRG
jgi:LysM repeat protein